MAASPKAGGATKRVRRKDDRARQDAASPAERQELNHRWRTGFFQTLAETSNVSHSCETAGVSPSTVYDLRRRDSGFAARW